MATTRSRWVNGHIGALSATWKLGLAVGTYVLWTALTWLLEGRIHTLLRPEATVDRLTYTVVVNLLVGTALALLLVREYTRTGYVSRSGLGFRIDRRAVAVVALAALAGVGQFLVQGPATTDAVVLTNVFFQVLPVSIAEVVVCWVLVGGTVRRWLRTRGTRPVASTVIAAAVASVLFGLYHVAHSPPFNSAEMVAVLTVVSLGTGVVYFVGRSAYAALVFHNFLALFGVVASLAAAGQIDAYQTLLVPLIATGTIAFATFAWLGSHLRDRSVSPTSPDSST